ncbi:nucleolar and spindle-associated protein 1 isoform X2 [Esox lucius]|uniref:nucleolar and spindle-associated protein 1 isoform X2 n=1 Tax=Esox lucius TaxID=8010 RepID=UPI001477736E|nr:nucleolar and spindle-associated protein 1 isoform X2 [Esox lucius]
MDLDSMKYAELRSIAKDVGIKASKLKADKLLNVLKQHFQLQQLQRDVPAVDGDEAGIAAQDENSTQDKLSPKPPVQEFVTKRRGKGRTKKRKVLEDEEPECELANAPLTSVEVIEEVAETTVGQQGVKRRRSSATNDSGVGGLAATVPEDQSQEPSAERQPGHKDVPAVTFEKGEEQKLVKPVGKIPRHEGLLKRNMLKPTTPNFKKLHEAHFKRMESIDSYMERKTKQIDLFRNSVKELKVLSDKTLLKPTEEKAVASSSSSHASLFSPAFQKLATTDKRRLTQLSAGKPATDKRRQTQASASKSAQKDTVVPFRPTILSTRRINVRFSQATKDNEHKRSMVKTPLRRSQPVDLITPGRETRVGGNPEVNKTSVLSSTKTPAFVFNANCSVLSNTPGTNKKANFDLKASLSKPLSYKPHKGKLKPFGVTKENASDQSVAGQSQAVTSHQNYKQHQVQTREERRTKQTQDRKQKKEKILGARRGLVMN